MSDKEERIWICVAKNPCKECNRKNEENCYLCHDLDGYLNMISHQEAIEAMARAICQIRLYEGKGSCEVCSMKRAKKRCMQFREADGDVKKAKAALEALLKLSRQ